MVSAQPNTATHLKSSTSQTPESLSIDPSIVPWSILGSYLCLATRSGENGRLTPGTDIYLISHTHPGGLPMFALRINPPSDPLPPPCGFHTSPSPTTFQATPSRMSWVSKEGEVLAEVTFDTPRSLRLRGKVDFSFDTEGKLEVNDWRNWLFPVPPSRAGRERSEVKQVEFTSRPDGALRFVLLKGEFELGNAAPSDNNNRRITVKSKEGEEEWELLIVERERGQSTSTEREESKSISQIISEAAGKSFEETSKEMQDGFEAYARGMCPWARGKEIERNDKYACYVMWTSTVRPSGYFKRESVLMSKLWMNKVWSWDNCFNCLALSVRNIDLAIDQLLVPFDHITTEGRLPDSICHSEILYDFTKPPIYGWVVNKLLELLKLYPSKSEHSSSEPFDRISRKNIEIIYSNIAKFTNFWYDHRSTALSVIPWYSHGNDSGWDNATCYDRQTMCLSPDLAAFLILQNDLLARMAGYLQKQDEASRWEKRRDEMRDALVNELWDSENGVFLVRDAFNGETWTSPTLLKYIPLVASQFLPLSIVNALTQGVSAHLTKWGLATEEPTSPHYESDGYWRGPIWAPPTNLIESGLRAGGTIELADEIAEKFMALCAHAGFAENYDALTGEGNRDLSYTWSASTYLVLRAEAEARSSIGGK